jgi:hypothetical protein
MGKCEVITFTAETADYTHRDVGKVRVMAEAFPAVNIRKVDLYEWDIHGRNGISERHTGMSKSSGVDYNKRRTVFPGRVNTINEYVLSIALQG